MDVGGQQNKPLKRGQAQRRMLVCRAPATAAGGLACTTQRPSPPMVCCHLQPAFRRQLVVQRITSGYERLVQSNRVGRLCQRHAGMQVKSKVASAEPASQPAGQPANQSH